MADEAEVRMESALKKIETIADEGGYMNKGIKEDILEMVSVIRECFVVMKTNRVNVWKETKMSQMEVNKDHAEDIAADDSSAGRQVPPSVDGAHEAGGSCLQLLTSSGPMLNTDTSDKVRHGMAAERGQHRGTPEDVTQQYAEMEKRITDKISEQVRIMMENFSARISKMIKGEIKSAPITKEPHQNAGINQNAPMQQKENAVNTVHMENYSMNQVTRSEHEKGNVGNSMNGIAGSAGEAEVHDWRVVDRRRNRKYQESRIGSMGRKEGNTPLQAAESCMWLHVSKIRPHVSERDVMEYLHGNGVEGDVSCQVISNWPTSKAFKVGVPLRYKDLVYSEEFWPSGIIFRPFRAPWKYRGGRDEEQQGYYNQGSQF